MGRAAQEASSLLNAGKRHLDEKEPDGGSRALGMKDRGCGFARLFGLGDAQSLGTLSISVPGPRGKGQMTPSPLSLLNGQGR